MAEYRFLLYPFQRMLCLYYNRGDGQGNTRKVVGMMDGKKGLHCDKVDGAHELTPQQDPILLRARQLMVRAVLKRRVAMLNVEETDQQMKNLPGPTQD